MSVLADGYSVIVQYRTLEMMYPGGEAGYRASCPIETYCCDGRIARVGFRTYWGMWRHVLRLIVRRFRAFDGTGRPHLVMLGATPEPLESCGWLGCETGPDGHRIAWLRGTEGLPLATPGVMGRVPTRSRSNAAVRG